MRFIAEGPDLPDELLDARGEGQVIFFCGSVSRAPRRSVRAFVNSRRSRRRSMIRFWLGQMRRSSLYSYSSRSTCSQAGSGLSCSSSCVARVVECESHSSRTVETRRHLSDLCFRLLQVPAGREVAHYAPAARSASASSRNRWLRRSNSLSRASRFAFSSRCARTWR